jgi:hypothetical protein
MRHYSLERWVDFARNVAMDENEKQEMQGHLDSGCKQCSKELRMWQQLQRFTQREATYSPAPAAVRIASARLATESAWGPRRSKPTIASVLFDSSSSPLAFGMRSAGNDSQQVLYGAGTYRIDVRVEPQMDSDKVRLIGQVLNSADPEARLSEIPVTLLKGREILVKSTTSQFGEFEIVGELVGGFRLVVMLPGRREVTLPLIDAVSGSEASGAAHLDASKRVKRKSGGKKKGTRTNV